MASEAKPLRGRRGAALVVVAVFLGALLAAAAVGVDVGRLAFTATEVQAVADAGAMAGAMTIFSNAHSGNARDPADDAIAVAHRNSVNGAPAMVARGDVLLGRFDFQNGSFLAGGVPQNAVQVTARATIDNIVAGVIGTPTSSVARQATGAMGGVGSAAPNLPIVVGDCKFRAYENSGSCSSLPSLSLVPDPTDNSGWTSLSASSASANEVNTLLPTACGGGGRPAPGVGVGDMVNVLNGDATSVLQTLDACVKKGIREFTIPIVGCGNKQNYNQAMTVVGFATIRISKVSASGKKKGIDLDSICKSQSGGGIGPNDFGTETVALVR
jgi:hypothetical protein